MLPVALHKPRLGVQAVVQMTPAKTSPRRSTSKVLDSKVYSSYLCKSSSLKISVTSWGFGPCAAMFSLRGNMARSTGLVPQRPDLETWVGDGWCLYRKMISDIHEPMFGSIHHTPSRTVAALLPSWLLYPVTLQVILALRETGLPGWKLTETLDLDGFSSIFVQLAGGSKPLQRVQDAKPFLWVPWSWWSVPLAHWLWPTAIRGHLGCKE